jgi:aminoglycoside phosphotransferase (APT) family kinase protein
VSGELSSPAVAACLRALRALDAGSWVLESVVASRNNSRIHRARSETRIAAIKECFNHATGSPDCVAAEREYAALSILSTRTSGAGLPPLAPLPLTLCREHAAYAMGWVAGRTSTELVLQSSTDLKRAAKLGESAALWLRRFHATNSLPPRKNDFGDRLHHVDTFSRLGRGSLPLLRRTAAILADRAADASAQLLPASWLHGDFKSDNLLIDEDAVTGLDVQLAFENTVAYDLAPFLNHLSLLRWSPRGFLRRRKLERMAAAFLEAYSPEATQWTLSILWLRAYLLMQIVAPRSAQASLRARVARWAAYNELARAIQEMEKCG